MKVLLIRPPVNLFSNNLENIKIDWGYNIPLGLLYIGSVLEKEGHQVNIYDAAVDFNPYDCNIHGHCGASWQAIRKHIDLYNPDVVGIENQFTTQIDNAIQVAEITKEVNPNIVTIIGGNHASVSPQTFFEKTDTIDIACMGEGEETIVEVLSYLRNIYKLREVRGIALRVNNRFVINQPRSYIENLDALPYPAYHLIHLERYFSLIGKGFGSRMHGLQEGQECAISMITSRGCPYNCVFCSIHLHMGRQWRYHTTEYVLRHIEYVVRKYCVRHIHFEDDNLTLNLSRFEAIVDGIIARKLNITWDTPNGVRADHLTKDIIIKSKKSGCIYFFMGVESGVPYILDKVIGKKLDLNKVVRVARWCHEAGLTLGAFFIIGFPGEKREEMLRTIEFALMIEKKYDVFPALFIATPLIGTRLFDICVNNNYLIRPLTPENLAKAIDGAGIIETEDFTVDNIAIIRNHFFKRHKVLLVLNFLRFIFKNPRVIFPILCLLLSHEGILGINKRKLLNIIFLKKSLLK